MDTIGTRLYAARKAKGLTQGEIAEALKVSINIVSKWENGKGEPRQKNHIDGLAKILGVSKVFLMFGEEYFEDAGLTVEDKLARLTTSNKELVHKFVDLLLEHQADSKSSTNGS